MADKRYRAPPSDTVLMVELGGLHALFDRRSMQTHLLAPPMPQILELLGDTPLDARTIAASLAASFDLGEERDVAARVTERLAELSALGLVETL